MRLFVGDTETTGVGSDDAVVEIAWMELDENLETVSQVRSLINPKKPIPAGASAVHGITDNMVKDAPTIEQFMLADGSALLSEGAVLVAHNAAFDMRFFQAWMPNALGTICTLKLSRVAYPDADNHKLQTLKFWLGLEVEVDHHEAHTALADVKVLKALFDRMRADMGWTSVEMFEISNMPQMVEKMPFGKHKGTKIKDLPRSYIKWLMGLDNLDDDLRHTLETLTS